MIVPHRTIVHIRHSEARYSLTELTRFYVWRAHDIAVLIVTIDVILERRQTILEAWARSF